MNTQSLNSYNGIKDKYEKLFVFNNEQEEVEYQSERLSIQFISEFNKLMDGAVTKKELAAAIGTSRSYITQLFNGTKLLNLETIANISKVLNAEIAIRLIPLEHKARRSARSNGSPVRIVLNKKNPGQEKQLYNPEIGVVKKRSKLQ